MKKRFIKFIMLFYKFQNRCRKCTCELDALRTGIRGEKDADAWRYTYWCSECWNDRFISSIESNPLLLNKYLNIHGKNPSEVIG